MINKYLKEHHQKVVMKSIKLAHPSKDEVLKKAKISIIVSMVLIIIGILLSLYSILIGIGLVVMGSIQMTIAIILKSIKQ